MLFSAEAFLKFVLAENKRLLTGSFCCPRYRTPGLPGCIQEGVENVGPLTERLVDGQFSARVEHIKHEVSHRRFLQHFVADFLSSESRLKSGKWARPAHIRRLFFRNLRTGFVHDRFRSLQSGRVLPSDDLSIQNYIFGQGRKRRG